MCKILAAVPKATQRGRLLCLQAHIALQCCPCHLLVLPETHRAHYCPLLAFQVVLGHFFQVLHSFSVLYTYPANACQCLCKVMGTSHNQGIWGHKEVLKAALTVLGWYLLFPGDPTLQGLILKQNLSLFSFLASWPFQSWLWKCTGQIL